MGKKMEDRKFFLGGPWDVIKSKNPVLSKGLFKPDLSPVVDKFDESRSSYDKLIQKKKELSATIGDSSKAYTQHNDAVGKLQVERDKVDKQDKEETNKSVTLLNKYSKDPDSDPADVIAAMDGFITSIGDRVTLYKSLTDEIAKHQLAEQTLFKKARDDYKSKSDAITNGIKKLEGEADKLDGQIRQILTGYQKTAVQMDNDGLVDDFRSLVDKL